MKIAVNATAWYRGAAGIGRYSWNLAHSLAECALDHELVVLVREGTDFQYNGDPRVQTVACRPTGPLWEQFQVPTICERRGVDVYHTPLFIAPVARTCAQVVTIHDVIPEKFPDHTPPDFMRLHRRFIGPSLRAADAVATVSHHSKRDVVETMGVPQEDVHVVHQALSEQFNSRTAREDRDRVRRKLGLSFPFVLYVGSLEPRKRAFEVIESLSLAEGRERDLHMVIAGRPLFKEYDPEAYAERCGMRNRVHYLGYVDDEDLPGLYGAAELLVFPSAYEGFGLPIVEAMACGCPVVSAEGSSLPEAGGEAAVYADPEDPEAFLEAILGPIRDPDAREERVQKGVDHAASFTRERFARELTAAYRKAVSA